MKYTSRDKDDEVCINRLKRIKHEPLSPSSIHSEDEQSSLSDESEDEDAIGVAAGRIRIGHDGGLIDNHDDHEQEDEDDNPTNHNNANSMTLKQEFLDDATADIPINGDKPIRVNRSRIDRIANRMESPNHLLTSLTPTNDTSPIAIDSNQTSSSTTMTPSTTITTTTTNTQTNRDTRLHHHYSHRRPSISRDRCDELKLSEQQQEHLSLIIRTIKEGNFDKFSELLGRKRDSTKNLLNVFVDGQTALHYSLIYGRSLAWCKQLVMNGANPNQTNKAGWHPIHLAAYSGSPETMLYLIDCFAD